MIGTMPMSSLNTSAQLSTTILPVESSVTAAKPILNLRLSKRGPYWNDSSGLRIFVGSISQTAMKGSSGNWKYLPAF